MKTVLMCDPTYFDVSYDINPWMTDHIGNVDKTLAAQQWNKLLYSISKYAIVKLISSVDLLPDLVFTANAGFVHNHTFILSSFSSKERKEEESVFSHWFKKQEYEVIQPSLSYEGEGDHLVDRFGRHWLGSGFRTDPNVYDQIAAIVNEKIHLLTLVNPNWYHLDTCFCPLPNGELLWYPQAFDERSQTLIRNSFIDIISVSVDDASNFACNCICLGNSLFLPKNSNTTYQLQKRGYKVNEFDLSEFIKSGGAAKCLTLYIQN